MTEPQAFAIIPSDIIMSRISDTAFRIYAIIYSLNYSQIQEIPDKYISELICKGVVTVNRAINELRKAEIIIVKKAGNRRYLTIAKTLERRAVESAENKIASSELPEGLKQFFKLWKQ